MLLSKFVLFTLLSTVAIYAKTVPLSEAKLKAFKSSIKALESPTLTILEGIDEGETYFLKLQYQKLTKKKILYAFIDKKTEQVYVGTRYEKDGTPSVFPKTSKAIAEIKKGVFFTFGTGKKEIYMVSDPDCRFCKKFAKATAGKLGKRYRVHVIYQVFSFHKKSPAMVEWIMQGKDDNAKQQRMEAIMVEGSKAYLPLMKKARSKAIEEKIADGLKSASALEAMGAPMFYDSEFNLLDNNALIKEVNQ